jgi:hypothetical protein
MEGDSWPGIAATKEHPGGRTPAPQHYRLLIAGNASSANKYFLSYVK